MFDHDGNGKISLNELQHMFYQTSFGDINVLKSLIKDIDNDKDGEINYREFRNILLNAM